jgi:preprotein translocase subunit SecA
LGTRTGSKAEAPDLSPDVAITDAAGNVVGHTYSDTRLAQREQALRQQIQQELDAKYAPHLQTLDQIRQERERQQLEADAATFSKGFVSELATLPLFEEHKAEIGAALKAMSLRSDHPDAVRAATYQAYHKIVGPKLAQKGSEQAVLADWQRKARANTSVNPGTAASTSVKSVASFKDLPPDAW